MSDFLLFQRVLLIAAIVCGVGSSAARANEPTFKRCASLLEHGGTLDRETSGRVVSSVWVKAGAYTPPTKQGSPVPIQLRLPTHCEVIGVLNERVGIDGQHYAVRFHLRLPSRWNGEFLFQGGGGSDGVLGDALGPTSSITPPALIRGYAVISQDAGHDNAVNSDPHRGGVMAFGFDPQARSDYGGHSLKMVADAGKTLTQLFYGHPAKRSYFAGCSKGGQEGMVFAQQYPNEFDGILASAPGFSLPRAAVAEAWDVQAIAAVKHVNTASADPLRQLSATFSDSDLRLAGELIVGVCDSDDGVKDGMIQNFPACTSARIEHQLKTLTCEDKKLPSCLSLAQVDGLIRIFDGVRDSTGKPLYSAWQWDSGIAAPGWRVWKLGDVDQHPPALNVSLGGSSLAAVFTSPPTAVTEDAASVFNYQMKFNFDRDASTIYTTDSVFTRSAWQDISARSNDLDAFHSRGGKLIVTHGVSDPVFSVLDTIAWYKEVDERVHGLANRFLRVFPVPGMNHCGGGIATDQYDAFSALKKWVEQGVAPEQILAFAGNSTPWPGRSRPLCPYPKTAHYVGHGNIERAASFVCQ